MKKILLVSIFLRFQGEFGVCLCAFSQLQFPWEFLPVIYKKKFLQEARFFISPIAKFELVTHLQVNFGFPTEIHSLLIKKPIIIPVMKRGKNCRLTFLFHMSNFFLEQIEVETMLGRTFQKFQTKCNDSLIRKGFCFQLLFSPRRQ